MISNASNALTMTSRSNTVRSAPAHQNFVFILPEKATAEDHALISTIANSMTGLGYVYVASADQTAMEDKGQVRYLPYRAGQFPSFGMVNALFVLRDRDVAKAALAEYRGAQAYLLEPRADISAHTAPAHASQAQHVGALLSFPGYGQLAAA